MKSALHGRIKELNHMVALHNVYFLSIVPVNNIQIYFQNLRHLLHIILYISGWKITFATAVNSLEWCIWLERWVLAEILSGKLDLELCFASMNKQFGKLFLCYHGSFLVTAEHFY